MSIFLPKAHPNSFALRQHHIVLGHSYPGTHTYRRIYPGAHTCRKTQRLGLASPTHGAFSMSTQNCQTGDTARARRSPSLNTPFLAARQQWTESFGTMDIRGTVSGGWGGGGAAGLAPPCKLVVLVQEFCARSMCQRGVPFDMVWKDLGFTIAEEN